MRTILLAVSALGVAAGAASSAGAQLVTPPKVTGPRMATGGGTLVYAQPIGAFRDNVRGGGGAMGHVLVRLGESGALALRIDGGFLVYGHERVRAQNPITGRVDFDVTTTNNIALAGVGPQLMVPTGRVRPYLNGSVGLAYFFTESSLSGGNNTEAFARTTNLSDGNFAYTGGGGVYIPLGTGRRAVSIDVGARYHNNGRTRYLTEDGITDNPDGSVTVTPIRGDANFVTYHLGVSMGF